MAKKNISKGNTAVSLNSGKVGNVRYYVTGGNTYTRSASNSRVTNPRTDAQMLQRLNFVSLNHFYGLFGKLLHGAFEKKEGAQSDFNCFMQANKGRGIYLTKEKNLHNEVHAMPVYLSVGSLDTIKLTLDGTTATSNISVGVSSVTTVMEISDALITAESKYNKGDALTVFTLKKIDGDYPSLSVGTRSIVLSNTDASVLTGIGVSDGMLTFTVESGTIAVAVVHMDVNKKVSTSVCALTTSAQEEYESYRTDEVFDVAAASYGTSTSIFLQGSSSASKSASSSSQSSGASGTDGGSTTPSSGGDSESSGEGASESEDGGYQ